MEYHAMYNIRNCCFLHTVVCNYACGPGEVANATCNGCDLTDICLRDMPCQNGGSCILLSGPDNYTCDCSSIPYSGEHCDGNVCIFVLFVCFNLFLNISLYCLLLYSVSIVM